MLKQLKQLISEASGQVSSRRVVTVIAFFLLCIAFLGNLFFKLPIADYIFRDFTLIVLAGLGVIGAEPMVSSLLARGRPNVSK